MFDSLEYPCGSTEFQSRLIKEKGVFLPRNAAPELKFNHNYMYSNVLYKASYLKYGYSGFRRRVIFYLFRGYLNRSLFRRKGICVGDGSCCRLTIPWCRHLEGGRCSIYERQPLFCRIFPIDEKDLELSDVKGVCAYYFED